MNRIAMLVLCFLIHNLDLRTAWSHMKPLKVSPIKDVWQLAGSGHCHTTGCGWAACKACRGVWTEPYVKICQDVLRYVNVCQDMSRSFLHLFRASGILGGKCNKRHCVIKSNKIEPFRFWSVWIEGGRSFYFVDFMNVGWSMLELSGRTSRMFQQW